jgi:hypothetical protein
MAADPYAAFPRPRFRSLPIAAAASLLAACATTQAPPPVRERTPAEIRADIARRIPPAVPDRAGWANDVYVALSSQGLATDPQNACAVLAVIEQESTYRTDPPVPNLGRIAHDEIVRRAGAHHIPAFAVDAALLLDSPNGVPYRDRIANARTEKQLSEIYEDFLGSVPLGKALFGGLNPVRTAGPMQVGVDFAEANADGYPYPPDDSIRHEVFSRRGGIWFGTKHLLDYRANYDSVRYRFADFNAGRYASRNAAFQNALSKATGIPLQPDGDLLVPGAPLERPGSTERAARALGRRLSMDDGDVRRALEKGGSIDFENTGLYRQVFALADRDAGAPLPRAVLPGIKLESPKITRDLTTAWFADRVYGRWQNCMRK